MTQMTQIYRSQNTNIKRMGMKRERLEAKGWRLEEIWNFICLCLFS